MGGSHTPSGRPPSVSRLAPGLFALLAAFAVGCPASRTSSVDEGPAGPAWFEDVTAKVGLDFVHDAGPTGTYFMPQIIGSGAALFDFNDDGRLDLYLINNGGPKSSSTNRLFRQEADGRFTDVSKGSGLDVSGHGMGVAIADVDNDGRPDVLLTEYGSIRLFHNAGGGTFCDVTRAAGLDNAFWATSACFFDYDRDGWLDLVVVNYVDYDPARKCGSFGGRHDYCHPNSFGGSVARLYRNRGPGTGDRGPGHRGLPQFEDVTVSSGLGKVPGPGLGVVCADFDGDGWPDIFVANDAKANRLWINRRDGTFAEEALRRGVAYNGAGQPQGNMGIGLADVDGDGQFDLFVTHLTEELHTLWVQGPRGYFRDRTAATGLARSRWRGTGFGTVLADFDHDGWPDLAFVNGRIARAQAPAGKDGGTFWEGYAERNQLFANDGGRFRDVSPDNAAFCGSPAVWRGLAVGDLDNDGAPDLVATQAAGPARLYRNVAPKRGHWLIVRAVDPALKRDAYGAVVTVQAGGRRWSRLLTPGSSYLCSNDPRAHFGLGSVDSMDAVRVTWPDGAEEAFAGGAVDRQVVLNKGAGRAVQRSGSGSCLASDRAHHRRPAPLFPSSGLWSSP